MTGANRGLGYAFARQLAERDIHVATARNLAQANNVASTGILVNSASPGRFRTDIGGPNAPRRVDQGADTPVWLATLADDGPHRAADAIQVPISSSLGQANANLL